MPAWSDKTGETNVNIYGSLMKIIEYKNSRKLDVLFDSGFLYKDRKYTDFKRGKIKSPYCKTVFNIGFLGEGKHLAWLGDKASLKYDTWFSMMRRCYEDNKNRNISYGECSVADEWHNFQNFGDWFDKNYYKIDNERMELDKDILVRYNKTYGPNACVFVPNKINSLFISQNSNRGECPIGVYYKKKNQKYCAQCNVDYRKRFYLGLYDTVNDAFLTYKNFKEKYIKEIAEEYKLKIPESVYNAMINYEVCSNN